MLDNQKMAVSELVDAVLFKAEKFNVRIVYRGDMGEPNRLRTKQTRAERYSVERKKQNL